MELGKQIKRYRADLHLSQEELADKIYVTRQTISNWENDKNYPDIHSLLLLSSVFEISLDQLIKGDTEIMKAEINKEEIQRFNRDSVIFTVLMIVFVLSALPLIRFLGGYGIPIVIAIYGIAMYYALKIERYKKKHDIHTYREIVAFTEGQRLDELEKARESGKHPYQVVLLTLASAVIALIVCLLTFWLLF